MVGMVRLGCVVGMLVLAACGAPSRLEARRQFDAQMEREDAIAELAPHQRQFLGQAAAICQARSRMYQATSQPRGVFGGLEVVASANRAERACFEGALMTGRLPVF